MSGKQPVPDPYRVLGVSRAATAAQIKGAHRALAKRYHPDAVSGDASRFVAVQEAYQTLSDPLRRREWDARNSPGPERAGEGPFRRRGSPVRGPAAGHWTREGPEVGSRRGTRGPRRPDVGPTGTGRPEPSSASYTWSADGVPWWEDHAARKSRSGRVAPEQDAADAKPADSASGSARPRDDPSGSATSRDDASGSTRPADDATVHRPPVQRRPSENAAPGQSQHGSGAFDVYSRSSGAAWSSAARRYFRQGDSDLPSRGVFHREGTQYVTGARAREVADAQARDGRVPGYRQQGTGDDSDASILRPRESRAAPRQGFEHDPLRRDPLRRDSLRASRSTPGTPSARSRTAGPATARRLSKPKRPRSSGLQRARLTNAAGAAPPASLDPGRTLALAGLAWLPVAVAIGSAGPVLAGCQDSPAGCPSLLAPMQAVMAVIALVIFAVVPSAGRAGALALVGALAVAIPLVVTAVLLGLLPPAPPIAGAGLALIVVVYLIVGGWALVQGRGRPPDARLS